MPTYSSSIGLLECPPNPWESPTRANASSSGYRNSLFASLSSKLSCFSNSGRRWLGKVSFRFSIIARRRRTICKLLCTVRTNFAECQIYEVIPIWRPEDYTQLTSLHDLVSTQMSLSN